MRLLIFAGFFLLFSGSTFGQKNITGRVTDGKLALSNVQITNLATRSKTTTDVEGQYQIMAEPRQELQYTYMGMDTVTIMMEDVTRILNVKMNPKVEELDEVTVSKTILKGQKEMKLQYDSNPNIIKSAFGFMDKEASAFSMRILDEEELDPVPDLSLVIQGRFAGVKAFCDPLEGLIVTMRGLQSINFPRKAVFDVDGMVLNKVDCYQFVGNIKRIAFIPSLNATSLYGTIGLGGVVVINTKTGTITPPAPDEGVLDQARLRNNFYRDKALAENTILDNAPQYLKDLSASKDKTDAIALYQTNLKKYRGSYPFLLESYRYFMDTWRDKAFADEILEQNRSSFEDDPVALKALAYVFEAQDRLKQAHEVYKEIYMLRPDYAQSFIDLANSYRNLGMAESAATMYVRHAYLQEEGMLPKDTVDLSRIMKRELDNLFALDNGTLKIKKRKNREDEEYSTRLVFEWNDSEAEFDLQFVNPGDQYFKWNHSMEDIPDRIRSEKELGYSMADFLLDDELPGVWKVNVTYLGNKQLTPTYLKATVYRNYGSKLQSKEVKVFQLLLKGANQSLFSIKLPSEVVHTR